MIGRGWLLGFAGEAWAAAYLAIRGYRICSWRKRFGRLEADIIVSRGGKTIVVEVKSGSSRKIGQEPESRLTAAKVENLSKICRILSRRDRRSVEVELVVVDFSMFWPRVRRYPKVCLW